MTPATRTSDLVIRQGGWSSFEDWRAEAPRIKRIAHGFQWAVAKWILWGEHRYGERYAQAVHETGLAEQTVLNILSVARAFPDARQRENLSFAHHATVAALQPAEQDRLLDKAEKETLSVTALRREVAARRPRAHAPKRIGHDLDEGWEPPHLILGSIVHIGEEGLCKISHIGKGATITMTAVRL